MLETAREAHKVQEASLTRAAADVTAQHARQTQRAAEAESLVQDLQQRLTQFQVTAHSVLHASCCGLCMSNLMEHICWQCLLSMSGMCRHVFSCCASSCASSCPFPSGSSRFSDVHV